MVHACQDKKLWCYSDNNELIYLNTKLCFSKFTFTNNNFENISGMSAIALYNGKGIISGNKLDSIKGIGIIVYDAIVEIKDNQFHHVFEEKIKIFEGNFGNT